MLMQLTTAEFTEAYQKVLGGFAAGQLVAWQEHTYKVRKGYSPRHGRMMFLFSYALDTWENTPGAYNYLTEDQMVSIIAKAK